MAKLPEFITLTVQAIYRSYEKDRRDEERVYLGASILGRECDRELWYGFRWCAPTEAFEGRMLRLFQTGHREEARMADDLLKIGIRILIVDPATNQQFEVSAIGGHLAGHLDGIATGFPEAPKAEHVCEFKTHNEKSFAALKKDGVEKAKPEHYAQMQIYMHLRGLKRAFYLAHNKNTDELYSERIEYDATKALALMARADRIIHASRPPTKLHNDPEAKAAWKCRFCAKRGVCHDGEFSRNNCRTCLHADPVEGGWHCRRFDKALSIDDQKAGCDAHLFIPDLVPGEQIDADEKAETVTYKMRDGSEWVDGAGKGGAA